MPPKPLQIRNSTAEFLIFTKQAGENGKFSVSWTEVRVQDGTIWLSQKLMAVLFDCSADNISLHLKNIFAEGKLDEISVAEDFSVTVADGKNYKTKHYNYLRNGNGLQYSCSETSVSESKRSLQTSL